MTDEHVPVPIPTAEWAIAFADVQREAQQFQRDAFAIRLFTDARKQALTWAIGSYGHECFESTQGIMARAETFWAFLTADHPTSSKGAS